MDGRMHVIHNQTERVIEIGGKPNLEIGEFPRMACAVGDPEMVLISPRSEIGLGYTHTSAQIGEYRFSFLENYHLNKRAWFGHVETLLM